MVNLNKDIILLILEKLQNDDESFHYVQPPGNSDRIIRKVNCKSLFSCLLVNRTWCETTVPILWKDPSLKFDDYHIMYANRYKILFNVMLLHLSEESRNNLRDKGIDIFTKTYQQPLFNYVSFWRHLDLNFLCNFIAANIEVSKRSIVGIKIANLFNTNTNLISLSYHSYNSDLIAKDILEGLAIENILIKKLEFDIGRHDNSPGIIAIIKEQKSLKEARFIYRYKFPSESYRKVEKSLIKCADTLQYLKINWEPITNYLTDLVNLVSLKISGSHNQNDSNWSHLGKLSLPRLKFLSADDVPVEILTDLIKNSKGLLTEINITEINIVNKQHKFDKILLIRTIYLNCPNLNFLRLILENSDIIEFENILINCRFLTVLEIIGLFNFSGWHQFFTVLVRSSPTCLFKFGIYYYGNLVEVKRNYPSILSFYLKWKWKNPNHFMLLKTVTITYDPKLKWLIENYYIGYYEKSGIFKKHDYHYGYEHFLWDQRMVF
jgi:hypothetical protein